MDQLGATLKPLGAMRALPHQALRQWSGPLRRATGPAAESCAGTGVCIMRKMHENHDLMGFNGI